MRDVALLAVLVCTVSEGGVGAQGFAGDAAAAQVARAADADRSGDVSAAEWDAFVQSLGADASGRIDREGLKARILAGDLDRDRDGALTADDLRSVFAELDADRDGALAPDELAGRAGAGAGAGGSRRGFGARLAAGVVARGADADADGRVSEAEWQAFLESIERDAHGAVAETAVTAWIAAAEHSVDDADRGAFTPGVYMLTLGAGLDADNNGVVALDDLQRFRSALDRNGDGAIAADELSGRQRGAGTRRRGWRSPTSDDRERPALMPWQRSLDDALALVEATRKPLLICVNMDGEVASEALAWTHYRDPGFVRLASGFIPVLASPDRRNARDHDDRGRRIADPKFGRVLNAEHIDIEPTLFERYFKGQRVAPRHVGVAPDGEILFDIYLVNDLSVVEAALAEHGRPGPAPRPASELDEDALLDSPDAGHRARLESLFATGDLATRVRLARAATSASRRTQHPEIVRMALRDDAPSVRLAAVDAVAHRPAAVPRELWVGAFGVADGGHHPGRIANLLDALHGVARDGDPADAQRTQAEYLRRVFGALALDSRLVDVERWRAALRAASATEAASLRPEDLDALDAELRDLAERIRANPDDRALHTATAAATLRYARIRMQQGQDPRFLLEDVRTAAAHAVAIASADPDGTALGCSAWASYLLDETERAAGEAALALPHLVRDAGTPLAAEVLHVLARARARAVYDAMRAGIAWPTPWIADVVAAHDVLLDHPAGTEAQAVAYADFLNTIEARGREGAALRRAVGRFPVSSELHLRLRGQLLRDVGARGLEAAYDALVAAAEPPYRPTLLWFAGLGSLIAAERDVQNQHPDDAMAAYLRSIARFDRSVADAPAFGDSAAHYQCLAHAGRARLCADAGAWDAARDAVRAAIAARPASLGSADGLGNAPQDTARYVIDGLGRADREADAGELREALANAGGKLDESQTREDRNR